MKISSIFSYYGGKSKIAHLYPKPAHDIIIEPFAGAAAYSWLYRDRDIWINELDSRTFSIWKFLLSDDARDWVDAVIPPTVSKGTRVSDIVATREHELMIPCPDGLIELMRAEANQGTQGGNGIHDQITSMAATCWPRMRPKILEVIPQIRHWVVTNDSYNTLPTNVVATWFVDAPYANKAGSRYRASTIDYADLSTWCRSLSGQAIVCENAGASWLPFTPFSRQRLSIKSCYQRANAQEVMWYNET